MSEFSMGIDEISVKDFLMEGIQEMVNEFVQDEKLLFVMEVFRKGK